MKRYAVIAAFKNSVLGGFAREFELEGLPQRREVDMVGLVSFWCHLVFVYCQSKLSYQMG
jgi:hypothetical protein